MNCKHLVVGMTLVGLPNVVLGSSESIGPNGIDAIGLLGPNGTVLTGSGVNVGQVEIGRVAVRGFDSNGVSNAFVNPSESRTLDGDLPVVDSNLDGGHPLRVASVVIGSSGAPTSVAPEAGLYSSGLVEISAGPTGYDEALVTTQYLANRFQFSDSRHIRAINHSWADFQPDLGNVDGNSLLTLGMDWIASKYDVLNIISGAQDTQQLRVPSDNYNGITVARSVKVGGIFKQVDEGNDNLDDDDAAGDRVSVDLLAPGVGIEVADAGTSNPTSFRTGTSYAAPHVTGTVALLNQYSDFQVQSSAARWDYDNTRKHEVMKAVLLNSADKLVNVHGSTRTVLDENGDDWTESDAFEEDNISLDQQMGAGHLNADRALRQFRSGEYNNGENVPNIGWDYGQVLGDSVDRRYPFSAPLGAGYVAVTLAWDREITKMGGLADTYDPTNTFSGEQIDDLDLFIVPAGSMDPATQFVARSASVEDNLEHIFEEDSRRGI